MVKKPSTKKKPAQKKKGPPHRFKVGNPGRAKGSRNKTTVLLKDSILKAAELAGQDLGAKESEGLVHYLRTQATINPKSFIPLLSKVLPLQLTGDGGGPIETADATLTTPEALALISKLQDQGAFDK